MCKVYEFPTKKQIPKEAEETLYSVAKDYVDVLTKIMNELCADTNSDAEYYEVMQLVLNTYLEAISTAIDELED